MIGDAVILYKYQMFAERLNNPDIGNYTAFGIAVYSSVDNNPKKLMNISDISTEKKLVEDLCELCNREQLEPVHVFDVIEDSIL